MKKKLKRSGFICVRDQKEGSNRFDHFLNSDVMVNELCLFTCFTIIIAIDWDGIRA